VSREGAKKKFTSEDSEGTEKKRAKLLRNALCGHSQTNGVIAAKIFQVYQLSSVKICVHQW
jgi:hypothetical protein